MEFHDEFVLITSPLVQAYVHAHPLQDIPCFIKALRLTVFFFPVALFLSFLFKRNYKLDIESGSCGRGGPLFIWILWRIHSSLAKIPISSQTRMIMLIQKERVDALLKSTICLQLLGRERAAAFSGRVSCACVIIVQMCQLPVGIFSLIALTT